MLSFGWQELILVAFVLVLVVGPKDMPRVLRGLSNGMARMRMLANEFRSAMIDVANQEEVKEAKQVLDDALMDSKTQMTDMTDSAKSMAGEALGDDFSNTIGEVQNIGETMKQPLAKSNPPSETKPKPQAKPVAAKSTSSKIKKSA
ncbi:MAG: twin-arginine translocase TatA/TatE family subunit [Proteobacteria bacterium]|nr:twin-arginine translocase TatA/TatE family subunit [Pseudomonadota bacterium]